MKVILLAIILMATINVNSQTITDTTLIMGRLKSNYYLFDIPKNPEGNGLKLLSPGEFVYIVNMLSTQRSAPQDIWYHCFYKSLEGYIPVSMIDVYGNWSTEKLDYLTTNKDKLFQERLSISKSVSAQSGNKIDSLNKREETIKDSLYAVLDSERTKFVTELGTIAKQEKIFIVSYSYPINILGYPGFKVRFINGSNKSIKYATFKITAYNRVNDPEGTKEVKCIGEILPFGNAQYEFEDVFISKVTDHYNIPTVKIQYMDNSTVTISGTRLLINYLNSPLEKLNEIGELDKVLNQLAISGLKDAGK
jgi:hypothetical protein